MNSGTIIAIIVLAAYAGLEAYAFKQASHRMEPAYIHNLLLRADAATQLCDEIDQNLRGRFDKTLARVTYNYREELTQENPDENINAIDQLISNKVKAARKSIEEELAQKDCSSPEMQKHFRRYEIYAKKTR